MFSAPSLWVGSELSSSPFHHLRPPPGCSLHHTHLLRSLQLGAEQLAEARRSLLEEGALALARLVRVRVSVRVSLTISRAVQGMLLSLIPLLLLLARLLAQVEEARRGARQLGQPRGAFKIVARISGLGCAFPYLSS